MNFSVIMTIQPLLEKATDLLWIVGNGLVIADLAGFMVILGLLIFEIF
ncbi:hypothetical protein [Methylosinus sp.]|jgi:hypothetical protein